MIGGQQAVTFCRRGTQTRLDNEAAGDLLVQTDWTFAV